MKISVLGNIIDTEDIYLIEPIKQGYYGFTIKFFNNKKLWICDEDPTINIYNPIVCEDLVKKLNKLRDEVIKYWSNNQSTIPKIEFDEIEENSKEIK